MVEAKPRIKVNVRRLVTFLLIVVLISLLVARVLSITAIWNTVLLDPILNFLVLTSRYFLGSFGLAVILLTIVIRLATFPLNLRQLRSSKALREIQPEIKELQRKYSADRQKLGQEVAKLYKEHGINALGCYVPMLIQFPIWIALYISVVQALAYTPENLLGLQSQLYSPSVLQNTVPLNHHFLWLDLTRGNIVMALVETVTMWVLMGMSSTPTESPQKSMTQQARTQQLMTRVLLWGIPLLMGLMTYLLPSGLSLYWVTSNIIGIILQYPITGWGVLKMPSLASLRRGAAQPASKSGPRAARAGHSGKTAMKGATRSVLPRQEGAKARNPSSKQKSAEGDAISPRRKDSDEESGASRKE
jgi:YidC/Oxa1 family membrane protein insertase